MSLHVGTGKASQAEGLLNALARGRLDHQFFSRHFLKRDLHDGQLEYVENANATVNCLATANRYGKTTVLANVHCHGCTYKTGGEPKYLNRNGSIDTEKWLYLKYHTIHTADLGETADMVWDEMEKLRGESPALEALLAGSLKSPRKHYDFITGSRWKFRTLGDAAEGIDGNSFHIVTIDEAGWVSYLEQKMSNVVRVRVADVRGCIHLVGTFKPGISRDFYKFCQWASSYTGVGIGFAHSAAGDESEGESEAESLDGSIRAYLREFFSREAERGNSLSADLLENLSKLGITEDELVAAVSA